MIRFKSFDEARATRTHKVNQEGRENWISRYFVATREEPAQPMGFLVEKKAHDVVYPHFHDVNQFQVIVGGYGKLGRFPVRPFSMHYTNGFTGYGPITGEDEGIAFFTLRNRWDSGAKYLPKQRSEMKPAPKRVRMAVNLPLSDEVARQARRDTALETLIEPEADGLASWFLRVPPGGKMEGPSPEAGGGQYVIVAGGTLEHADRAFGRLALGYVPTEAGPLPVQAGPDGVELLVMQFPDREARPPA